MNQPTDQEELLTDALADDAPHGFRDALLNDTLRHARSRRRRRQGRRAVAALAAVSLLGTLIGLLLPRPFRQAFKPPTSYQLVHTQSLPASQWVSTTSLPTNQWIASTPTIPVIHTESAGSVYQSIDDDELLALVAPRAAALVRCGPQCEQLVFVNPADEKGFPIN